MFHQRTQSKEEQIDAFIIAALRKLEKTYNFQDKERMIRDRVVIGVHDDTVRENLLESKNLTLEKATQICRAHEASRSQTQSMSSAKPGLAQRLGQTQPRGRGGSSKFGQSITGPGRQKWRNCQRCRRDSHKRQDCPPRNAKCRKCQKLGHYATVCKARLSTKE